MSPRMFAGLTRDEAAARLRAANTAYGFVNDVRGACARHPALRRVTVETPEGPVSIGGPAGAALGDGPRSPWRPVPALGASTGGDPRGIRRRIEPRPSRSCRADWRAKLRRRPGAVTGAGGQRLCSRIGARSSSGGRCSGRTPTGRRSAASWAPGSAGRQARAVRRGAARRLEGAGRSPPLPKRRAMVYRARVRSPPAHRASPPPGQRPGESRPAARPHPGQAAMTLCV